MIKSIFNYFYGNHLRRRRHHLENILKRPHETQRALLMDMIVRARATEWGRQYGFPTIRTPEQFSRAFPVQNYETLKPFIERMMLGEKHVLWPGRTKHFSKSSGTTSDRSKYLPVSQANMNDCHLRGTRDTMTFFYDQVPNARQFEGKSLLMGGNMEPYDRYPDTLRGDISALMIGNMPMVARPFVTPDFETALMADFEKKIERMAQIVSREKELVMIGGVPTWTVVLFRRVLELTGAQHLLEVWPNLQGYIHGGVSFKPYREQFRQFLPDPDFAYQEIYNASEGYFASQHDFSKEGMLLLLDNGVYYEFLPLNEWNKEDPQAIPLSEVVPGKDYAMIITTNAGLWRYMIGDTVAFVSTDPYVIRVTGRTKQFVNAFGEEVMVENTDEAISRACRDTGASVNDYTLAPIYFSGTERGGHEWLIEFETPPPDTEQFAELLDRHLQAVNSDYAAKRYQDLALQRLTLRVLPANAFNNWLKKKGKFGGQHKVPRLANHREYVEEILSSLNADT